MKKWTNFVNESNKIIFNKNILITLDNGIVLEAKLDIKDLNESFANDQLKENILNKTIKSYCFLKENKENIDDKPPVDIGLSEIFEYYVPWSSIFDDFGIYSMKKISEALLKDEHVISVYEDHAYGWSNQPEVAIVKIECTEYELPLILKHLTTELEKAFGTEWIRLSKKDW